MWTVRAHTLLHERSAVLQSDCGACSLLRVLPRLSLRCFLRFTFRTARLASSRAPLSPAEVCVFRASIVHRFVRRPLVFFANTCCVCARSLCAVIVLDQLVNGKEYTVSPWVRMRCSQTAHALVLLRFPQVFRSKRFCLARFDLAGAERQGLQSDRRAGQGHPQRQLAHHSCVPRS